MKAVERLKVTAMPQLITLDDAEVKHAIAECKAKSREAKVVEPLSSHVSLLDLDTPAGGYYFLFDTVKSEVLYLVRYKLVELHEKLALPSGKAYRQVLVWRNSGDALTTKIAEKVFWQYLYPKYRCLVSDSQQSEKGKEFWQYQVSNALEKKMTVKVVNTNDWVSTTITSMVQLSEISSKVWGKPEWFRRMVIVIY